MDVMAHGLWGGAMFCAQGRRKFLGGLLIGMAPDLLSFGVFHVMQPGWMIRRLAGEISGPPALSILPAYVFYAYNVTHSLLVWAIVFLLLWLIAKHPPWLLAAWGIHVLCDIPTHGSEYFPTPFLWPLPTPFVDGISWASREFLVVNYATLIAVYSGLFWYIRRNPRRPGASSPL